MPPPKSSPKPNPHRSPISRCPRPQTKDQSPIHPRYSRYQHPKQGPNLGFNCCQCSEYHARKLARSTTLLIGTTLTFRFSRNPPEDPRRSHSLPNAPYRPGHRKPPSSWHPSATIEPSPLPLPMATPLAAMPRTASGWRKLPNSTFLPKIAHTEPGSLLINRVRLRLPLRPSPPLKYHRRCSALSHWHYHQQYPHPLTLGPYHQAHHVPGDPLKTPLSSRRAYYS